MCFACGVVLSQHYKQSTSPGWGSRNAFPGCSIPAQPRLFYIIFLRNFDHNESFRADTCLENVVGGKQGHAPCKIFLLHQRFFYVRLISWRLLDCHKVDVRLATLSFGDVTKFKTVMSVCLLRCCITGQCYLSCWLLENIFGIVSFR